MKLFEGDIDAFAIPNVEVLRDFREIVPSRMTDFLPPEKSCHADTISKTTHNMALMFAL